MTVETLFEKIQVLPEEDRIQLIYLISETLLPENKAKLKLPENYSNQPVDVTPDLKRVQAAYQRYIEGRNGLLVELQLKAKSNRDPLGEFSEWLVAALVQGTLAPSRVQKGWDVLSADHKKIQVKYLANPADGWINEHLVQVTELMDEYAIVIFEALLPQAVIVFPARSLTAIGMELGKRHGNQETILQFTRRNYLRIRNEIPKFKDLGVQLYLPPDWLLQ